MLFLCFIGVVLSTICTVYGEWDQSCVDNCSCCINNNCGNSQGFSNACLSGCIDGHRGVRCYELCSYGNCKSCGGITQSNVCTECYDGYYLGLNRDCTSPCPSTCKSCSSDTHCTECKNGYYDEHGSTTCRYVRCSLNCDCNGQDECVGCKAGYYDTSTSCTKKCPVNCRTCESEELCNECKNGFYNGFKYDNGIKQLNNCTHACRDTCTQCQSYNNCLHCVIGKYGSTCQENCSLGCKDKSCSFDNGQCACRNNFTGEKCLECVNGKYGSLCNQTCPKYCKSQRCERTSGDCTDGCINANVTGSNCSMCKEGMYGELCDMICPNNCKHSKCKRYSGICSDGCKGNFNGTKCDACKNGQYGENCDRDCPVQCAGNICENRSGNCYNCKVNFKGKKCDECMSGYNGPNCDEPCSRFCANFTCDRDTGKCSYGCLNGYSGDRCCVMSENCVKCYTNEECQTCIPGFFKTSCNETCPGCCKGSCHMLTGECILNEEIQQQKDASNSGLVPTAAVLGSMLVLSFAFNIVLFALFLLKKIKITRRKHIPTNLNEPTYENQLENIEMQFPRTTHRLIHLILWKEISTRAPIDCKRTSMSISTYPMTTVSSYRNEGTALVYPAETYTIWTKKSISNFK